MRIEQPDGDDTPAPAPELPDVPVPARPTDSGATRDAAGPTGEDGLRDRQGEANPEDERAVRISRVTDYRATVEAAYRAYAIDQAYEKIRETERNVVTPAMKRIEAEDPDRHLAGLEHRLKGKDRFTEKVTKAINEQPQLTHTNAVALVKDAIRYTFQYRDDQYTAGVLADCNRLERAGFKRVDRRNTWESPDYKGINSRWRAPESDQMLEVQFHTAASYAVKQETHAAYEKLRDPATPKAEQVRLADYQRQVNTRVPTPTGALDISDYP